MTKKNILYITRTMGIGGTENVIIQLCEAMKDSVDKIIVCSCGGINVNKLEHMGIKHYKIPDICNRNILDIIKILISVYRIIQIEEVNIVHTHHRMAAFFTRIILFVKRFHFINTAHNVFWDKKKLTRFAYKKAHLIAVGKGVKENLCGFFNLPDSQVTVIYNAVRPFNGKIIPDTTLAKYREKEFFLVGNIGRLTKQKGMEYFIRSIPEVRKFCPNTKFLIIGAGEDEVDLKTLIADMKLTEDVIFLGYREDVQNIMAQLDLIILSSLWEGLPLTPMEAFSVKKTIIATSVDGTPEIVINGVNGILVEPKNTDALSVEIIELYKDRSRLKLLETNAYQFYKDKLTYERFIQDYTNLYNIY